MSYTLPKRVKLSRQTTLLVILLMVITLAITGFVSAYKKVYVKADGNRIAVDTLYNSPADILLQAGIKLDKEDEFRVLDSKLRNGSTIEVFRAVPVTVIVKGQSKTIVSGKPTVGELVESLGYSSDGIKTDPDGKIPVQAGMQIVISLLSEKTVEQQISEPFPVIRRPDSTLEKGMEEVEQEGVNGEKLQTVRIRYADDKQVGQEVLSEKVIVPAKPEIRRVGARDTIETSRGSLRFSRVEMMEATAYLPTDGSDEGITATGIPARHGIVAVDPDVIPLGTRVYVNGYGMALAADTGGAIVGNRIDVCMESYSEAMQFGRRLVKVYVLE